MLVRPRATEGVRVGAPGLPPRRDIQGLRAVAVLAVVLNHLTDWPAGGFVGVDIFFVISGYLITALLLREHQRTGRISYRGFYARRLRRVVPAAVVVLFVTVVLSFALLGASRARETLVDAIWAFCFAANWRFLSKGTDYFSQGLQPSPLQHYWSLGVEEQFYLVWPWLMLALLVLGSHRLGWTRRRGLAMAGATIAALSAVSFVLALHGTTDNPTGAYFSSVTRTWELGVGAFVAVTAGAYRRIHPAARTVLAWTGLGGVVASVFVVSDTAGFPAPWAALPVLSTALVIVAGEGVQQRWLFPLTNRASTYLGDISYSLYLWHFPVVVLLLAYFSADDWQYYAVGVPLMGLLSVASFRLVEDPVRRSDWLSGPWTPRGWSGFIGSGPVQNAGLLATGFVVLVMVFSALNTPEPPAPSLQMLRAASSVSTDDGDHSREPCLGAASIGAAHCAPLETDAVYPEPDGLAADVDGYFDCLTLYDARRMKTCAYGVPRGTGRLRVAFVGDSHAAMLIPGLSQEAIARHWELDSYFGQGCVWGGANRSCPAIKNVERTLQSTKYDVVLTTAYRTNTGTNAAQAAHGIAAAWKPVLAKGTKVVAIADDPKVSKAAMECVSRVRLSAEHNDCRTPVKDAFAEQDPFPLAVRASPKARLVDMRRFYCASTCPAVIGNVIVYRDERAHLSGTYSQTLGPYLAAAIRRAIA